MRATLLLADSAQVADGKLYILGGGWNITGPAPAPLALAILVEVPWDRTNERHRIKLELLDADGDPVEVPQADGALAPLVVEGEFEVGRATGLRPGTPINFPFAVGLPPPPTRPGSRYEWRLHINGQTTDDWRAAFSTRPA